MASGNVPAERQAINADARLCIGKLSVVRQAQVGRPGQHGLDHHAEFALGGGEKMLITRSGNGVQFALTAPYYYFLGDRLAVPDTPAVPPLTDLVVTPYAARSALHLLLEARGI